MIDKEMDEASNYKEKRALSLIEDALEKSKPKRQLSGSSESLASVSSSGSSVERRVKANLPKLELITGKRMKTSEMSRSSCISEVFRRNWLKVSWQGYHSLPRITKQP